MDLGDMRRPYNSGCTTFDLGDLKAREPFGQFTAWFEQARSHEGVGEANAMCLSTATAGGLPSGRMVLLKHFGRDGGFVFFTNYDSRKGRELAENPYASLTFYWAPLKRMVRVEGAVDKVSEEESEAYFKSRPFGSRVGAAVSDQSKVIRDRAQLTEMEEAMKKEYAGREDDLPRPKNWGGFRVVPRVFEFWQGQTTRLHDRLRFRKEEDADSLDLAVKGQDGWIIERLAP